MVADDGGLADYHAGSMVDEEVLADLGASIDVHAGAAVRVLGHDAGDQRHVLRVKLVGDAVHEYGEEARVAEDDLFLALRRRVAVEGGLHIGKQHALDLGQLAKEVGADSIYALARFLARGIGVLEQKRLGKLAAQGVLNADKRFADEVLGVGAGGRFVAEVAGEHHAAKVFDHVGDCLLVGEVAVGVGEEDFLRAVVLGDARND